MTTTGAGPRVRTLPPGVSGEQLREIKAKEREAAGLPVETEKERKARIHSQNAKRAVKRCATCGLPGHTKATCARRKPESAAPADANPREGSRAHAAGSEVVPASVRRRAPEQQPRQKCGNCGEAGHNAKTCPLNGGTGAGRGKAGARVALAGHSAPRASAPPSKPAPTRQLTIPTGAEQLVPNGLLSLWVLTIMEDALVAELAKVRQMRVDAEAGR